MRDDVRACVTKALAKLADQPRFTANNIGLDTNIVLDLGLTSMKFVDLLHEIEDGLPVGEFPMQEWIDAEQARGEGGFRVRSLIDFCVRLIEER